MAMTPSDYSGGVILFLDISTIKTTILCYIIKVK